MCIAESVSKKHDDIYAIHLFSSRTRNYSCHGPYWTVSNGAMLSLHSKSVVARSSVIQLIQQLSIQLIYNATIHRGTKFTPNFPFFDREVRLPNTIFDTYTVPDDYSTLEQHALSTVIRLRQWEQILLWAKQNNKNKLKLAKTCFDRNAAAVNTHLLGTTRLSQTTWAEIRTTLSS